MLRITGCLGGGGGGGYYRGRGATTGCLQHRFRLKGLLGVQYGVSGDKGGEGEKAPL